MSYKIKRQLKRLSNKQIEEDIKKYIKTSYDFYEAKSPEFEILAKRLHDEYSLEEFYRLFNKFWRSGYHDKASLAIYTLSLYERDFNLDTWDFLKLKLREINSWDQADIIGEIIGKILIKYPKLEIEIRKMSISQNLRIKRIGMMAAIPQIRRSDIKLAMKLVEMNINSKEENTQTGVGKILCEIGKIKPEFAKRFILKNMNMPSVTFNIATENMRELRGVKRIKKLNTRLNTNGFGRLIFWKDVR